MELLSVHRLLKGPGKLVLPDGGEEVAFDELELVGVTAWPVRRRICWGVHLPLTQQLKLGHLGLHWPPK